MTVDEIVTFAVGLTLLALIVGTLVFEIVWIKKTHKKYVYRFQTHEIVFEVAIRGLRLYIDGNVEDELSARSIRICTLRAFADGTEIKARFEMRALKVYVDVTAGGTPLPLIGMGK